MKLSFYTVPEDYLSLNTTIVFRKGDPPEMSLDITIIDDDNFEDIKRFLGNLMLVEPIEFASRITIFRDQTIISISDEDSKW